MRTTAATAMVAAALVLAGCSQPAPEVAASDCTTATPALCTGAAAGIDYLVAPRTAPDTSPRDAEPAAGSILLIDLGGPTQGLNVLQDLAAAVSTFDAVADYDTFLAIDFTDALPRMDVDCLSAATDAAVRSDDPCDVAGLGATFAERTADAVDTVLTHLDITRYDLLGHSYAAARWAMAETLLDVPPDDAVFTAPLPAGLTADVVAEHQASAAREHWDAALSTSCSGCQLHDEGIRVGTGLVTFDRRELGAVFAALDPAALHQWTEEASRLGRLDDVAVAEQLDRAQRGYRALNAAGHATDGTVWFRAAFCAATVRTEDPATTRAGDDELATQLQRYLEGGCGATSVSPDLPFPSMTSCVVIAADDSVTPVDSVVELVPRTVSTTTVPTTHGDLFMLVEEGVRTCA